jgi:hypothetical protein
MKRTAYTARIVTPDGTVLAQAVCYAHNSGIRASERLAGDRGRATGQMFAGDRPERDATTGIYRRTWRGVRDGAEIIAVVAPAD